MHLRPTAQAFLDTLLSGRLLAEQMITIQVGGRSAGVTHKSRVTFFHAPPPAPPTRR